MKNASDKQEPATQSQVRYSSTFLASERRKTRRSTLWGAIFGAITSAIALAEGVRAWSRHESVNMGARFSYAQYPPLLVTLAGLIGLAACGCCLWWVWRDRNRW